MRFLLDTSLIFIFIRYSSKDVLFIGEYIIIKLHILKYDGIIIVRGGQSFWLFMVILAHKFISSRTHVPTNHEKCGYPPTLTPQIKMIPLYQTFVPFAQIIIATPKIVLMLKNFGQCLFQKFYSKLTSNIK